MKRAFSTWDLQLSDSDGDAGCVQEDCNDEEPCSPLFNVFHFFMLCTPGSPEFQVAHNIVKPGNRFSRQAGNQARNLAQLFLVFGQHLRKEPTHAQLRRSLPPPKLRLSFHPARPTSLQLNPRLHFIRYSQHNITDLHLKASHWRDLWAYESLEFGSKRMKQNVSREYSVCVKLDDTNQ